MESSVSSPSSCRQNDSFRPVRPAPVLLAEKRVHGGHTKARAGRSPQWSPPRSTRDGRRVEVSHAVQRMIISSDGPTRRTLHAKLAQYGGPQKAGLVKRHREAPVHAGLQSSWQARLYAHHTLSTAVRLMESPSFVAWEKGAAVQSCMELDDYGVERERILDQVTGRENNPCVYIQPKSHVDSMHRVASMSAIRRTSSDAVLLKASRQPWHPPSPPYKEGIARAFGRLSTDAAALSHSAVHSHRRAPGHGRGHAPSATGRQSPAEGASGTSEPPEAPPSRSPPSQRPSQSPGRPTSRAASPPPASMPPASPQVGSGPTEQDDGDSESTWALTMLPVNAAAHVANGAYVAKAAHVANGAHSWAHKKREAPALPSAPASHDEPSSLARPEPKGHWQSHARFLYHNPSHIDLRPAAHRPSPSLRPGGSPPPFQVGNQVIVAKDELGYEGSYWPGRIVDGLHRGEYRVEYPGIKVPACKHRGAPCRCPCEVNRVCGSVVYSAATPAYDAHLFVLSLAPGMAVWYRRKHGGAWWAMTIDKIVGALGAGKRKLEDAKIRMRSPTFPCANYETTGRDAERELRPALVLTRDGRWEFAYPVAPPQEQEEPVAEPAVATDDPQEPAHLWKQLH